MQLASVCKINLILTRDINKCLYNPKEVVKMLSEESKHFIYEFINYVNDRIIETDYLSNKERVIVYKNIYDKYVTVEGFEQLVIAKKIAEFINVTENEADNDSKLEDISGTIAEIIIAMDSIRDEINREEKNL